MANQQHKGRERDERSLCTATNRKGERCKAYAVGDSGFCAFHHPDYHETIQAGRITGIRAGNINRHGLLPENHLPIRSYAELIDFLNALLGEALEIESTKQMILTTMKIVPALGSAIQAEELQAMSERIERLEAKQAGRLLPGVIVDD
jgi:hypothetical protein